MKKTIGVIFSGYGQQFVTMGKDIYNESRHVQDLFEQASMCLNINFVQLSFASSDAEMSEVDKGYLAILLMQISIYSELSQAGLRPDFIAGYGIGEYAAAVASGSLSFADGLYLLSKYAKILKAFVEQNPNYAVLSLPKGFSLEVLEKFCEELSTDEKKVFVSAHNTQHGFYIAGHVDLLELVKEYCKLHEIRKVKELSVSYGLHSVLVDSIVSALSPYLFKIDFKPLKFPVITNVDGVYVTSPDALESAILRGISSRVLWNEVMHGFVGCEVLICVGPGKQVAEWAIAQYPDKEIYCIENLADLKKVKQLLQEDDHEVASSDTHRVDEGQAIAFGVCHIDNEIVQLPEDLTIADEINELPDDYDVDEEEE
ncbi:MAG: ACP S-malonyltransferase [Candidatus Chromulinivorax sp.]|nr:ACP S-malonyltransferase [Candidatus Chromulinivorax sp.]